MPEYIIKTAPDPEYWVGDDADYMKRPMPSKRQALKNLVGEAHFRAFWYSWREAGFTDEEIWDWGGVGPMYGGRLTLPEAILWRAAGFSPDAAAAWVECAVPTSTESVLDVAKLARQRMVEEESERLFKERYARVKRDMEGIRISREWAERMKAA